jgi:DNA polymerase-1
MLNVDRAIKKAGLKTKMIMQVHDELLFEAPKDEVEKATEIIKHEMEHAAKLDAPLVAEIGVGNDWMSAK